MNLNTKKLLFTAILATAAFVANNSNCAANAKCAAGWAPFEPAYTERDRAWGRPGFWGEPDPIEQDTATDRAWERPGFWGEPADEPNELDYR